MDTEITTGAERAQADGTEEPRLSLTELHDLLRAATALERASRPIVIHAAAEPATMPSTALAAQPVPTRYAHPGIDVDTRGRGFVEIEVPAWSEPLPEVRTPLEFAPLGLVVFGAGFLAALFATVLLGAGLYTVGADVVCLAVAGTAASKLLGGR